MNTDATELEVLLTKAKQQGWNEYRSFLAAGLGIPEAELDGGLLAHVELRERKARAEAFDDAASIAEGVFSQSNMAANFSRIAARVRSGKE